ncbi:hypothetical protein IFM89_024955 [Coptis chinensis]|uniref:Uncharacterized protein n=1 Tax=Coptis chinensis TaxID=261450 RepID=A0A835IPB2_9MAGN|nr:hypothetical protein IFM89_024955 [Coptis chinensis]
MFHGDLHKQLGFTAIGLKKVLCLLFEEGMWMSMKRWSSMQLPLQLMVSLKYPLWKVEVVEAPVHSGQDEVLPVTEPASTVPEDTPKKSYASIVSLLISVTFADKFLFLIT